MTVGKSFLAQALGYSAIRAGHTVRFAHADDFFKALAQARVDNSVDRIFRSLSRVNYICRLASISFAGSPPWPGPVAGQRWSGSWGRQTPG